MTDEFEQLLKDLNWRTRGFQFSDDWTSEEVFALVRERSREYGLSLAGNRITTTDKDKFTILITGKSDQLERMVEIVNELNDENEIEVPSDIAQAVKLKRLKFMKEHIDDQAPIGVSHHFGEGVLMTKDGDYLKDFPEDTRNLLSYDV